MKVEWCRKREWDLTQRIDMWARELWIKLKIRRGTEGRLARDNKVWWRSEQINHRVNLEASEVCSRAGTEMEIRDNGVGVYLVGRSC